MSTHEVKIVKIESIRPHLNADSLEILDIWGYQCVVRHNQYKIGDMIIYIEPDFTIKLSRPEFSFLDTGKGKERERITTRKFRGEISYGLVIPAPKDSVEGDNVLELLEVERYEPPMGGHNGSGKTGFLSGMCEKGPDFNCPEYGLENYKKFSKLIPSGTPVIYTNKIHGSSARYVFSSKDDKFFCGSRTTWKKPSGEFIKSVMVIDELTGQEIEKRIVAPENAWYTCHLQNPWIETWCRNNPDQVLYGELYGCFQYKTPIKLADGSSKMIGHIVNSKLPLFVKTLNIKTGLEESKKIIGFSKQKSSINEWLYITYKRKNWGGKATGLTVTKNHKIFTKNFLEIEAENLNIGDTVYLYSPKTLNWIQEQFLLGTLLGDGFIGENNVFEISHCEKQTDYLMLKKQILNNISSDIKNITSGFGSEMNKFYTKSLNNLSSINFYNFCYSNNGKKKVTKKWLNSLTPLAIAFWYCDDGSLSQISGKSQQCDIATNSFSVEELELIVEFFKEKNIECYYYSNESGNILKFSPTGTRNLHIMLAPYITETMRYKLHEDCKNIKCLLDDVVKICEKQTENYIETVITGKRNVTENEFIKKQLQWKYDIEIEDNHNYFANKILVHNSNVQGSRFHYGMKDKQYGFAVFDILKDGNWVDNLEVYFNTPGIETVKVLFSGFHDAEIVKSLAELSENFNNCGHIREGVVIKTTGEHRIALKWVSDQYYAIK